MKKILFLILLTTNAIISQTIKIIPGVYKSEKKGQNVTLRVNEDNSFGFEFMSGKLETVKDTVYFKDDRLKIDKFTLEPIENHSNSDVNIFVFNDKNLDYALKYLFIGTQKNNRGAIIYKRLTDYSKNSDKTDAYPENITLSLPKTNFVYIVDSYYDVTTVSKFAINQNQNNYKVNYDPYNSNQLLLKGYIDPLTKELAISEGRDQIFFSFVNENDLPKKDIIIKPLSELKESNWTKKNGFSTELDVYADKSDSLSQGNYKFKYKIEKNFSAAVKETAKTPKKNLIVVYNPSSKNNQKDFDAFIKENQTKLSDYMYSEYNLEYDKFNFYLAKSSDKKLLSQYNIQNEPLLLFFNSNGEMFYHTKGTITDKKELFSTYNYIASDIEAPSKIASIDAVLLSKKSDNKAVIKALKKSLLLNPNESDNNFAITSVNQPPVYETLPPPKINSDDAIVVTKEAEKDTNQVLTEIKEEIADSTVVALASDDYYNLIKDKENLYKIKSNQETINKRWGEILDFYLSKKQYDKDVISIISDELMNVGFNNKLYGDVTKTPTANDFLALDYLFAVYPNIKKNLENVDEYASRPDNYDYSEDHYQESIPTVLSNFFTDSTSKEGNPEKIEITKLIQYYKKYNEIVGSDIYSVLQYLNIIRIKTGEKEFNQDYVNEFDKLFSKTHTTSSIIEDLDVHYSLNKTYALYDSWDSFKNAFANQCNDVSWHIVETSKDKNLIQKAIHWSETSLKINKENHYYLDTLAQLYYLDNQKTKAIETEKKAIKIANEDSDKEVYEKVLEKIKNGTY